MANGVLLILLLLSAGLAAPITLSSEINFPYTDSSQNVNYTYKARLSINSGNSTIALTAADHISQLIKTWYVKIDQNID